MAGRYRSALAAARIIAIGICAPHTIEAQTTLIPVISSMVSGASFQPGPIAPGEVITFFGIGLGSSSPLTFKPDNAGRIPYTLGSTRVLFNETAAPLLYASSTRVIAMVPVGLAVGTSVTVRVENLGVLSPPVIARVEQSSPGLFTASQDGRDQAAALNQNMTVNSAGNPATPGSIVSLFVSGGGRTQPTYSDGVVTGSSPPLAASAVGATVAGLSADVTFAGLAPGLVSGVFQVNVRLPSATPSGNRVHVAVNTGGRSSQVGVTIAVAGGSTALPAAPQGLQATATAAGVDLRWGAANANIRQVRVERVSSTTGEFAEVASLPVPASSWIDPQVQPQTSYRYRIRFETPAGLTDYSAESGVLIQASYIPPPQPAVAAAVSASRINLLWTNNSPGTTGIVVERSIGGAFVPAATLGAPSSFYRDSNVASSTTYSYRLRALTSSGTSNASREVTATTPSLPPLPDSAPRIHPADPHRLAMDGEIWFPAGYYPSVGTLVTDQVDYTYYIKLIDTLAANGVNFFRNVFSMGQTYGDSMPLYVRTGPGNARDGRLKFDLNQLNQNFFNYWRSVAQYARAKGIVMQICITDGWHTTALVAEDNGPFKAWGLQYDYYYSGNNINGVNASSRDDLMNTSHPVYTYQQALVRKLVDTLGDLPNVIWEIANESGNLGWELIVADYLTSYEKSKQVYQHLVIPRDLPGHQYAPGQCDNSPTITHRDMARLFPQNLVLITDNDCVGPDTPEVRRAKAWASLTGGGHINFFHFQIVEPAQLTSDDAVRGMRYIGLQRRFLSELAIDLAGMIPLDGEVTNGWALGRSGAEYIIYLPAGGSTSVPALASASRAVWFNPRDGSTIPAANTQVRNAPDSNDWVLYLHK